MEACWCRGWVDCTGEGNIDADSFVVAAAVFLDCSRYLVQIKRNAATGRLPLGRFEEDNDELSAAVKQYIPVLKEVLERVG